MIKKIEVDPDDRVVIIYKQKIYRKSFSEIATDILNSDEVQDIKLEDSVIYVKEHRW